jgi:hypothetical protein
LLFDDPVIAFVAVTKDISASKNSLVFEVLEDDIQVDVEEFVGLFVVVTDDVDDEEAEGRE